MEPTKHNIKPTETEYVDQMVERANKIKEQIEGISGAVNKLNKLDPKFLKKINKAIGEAYIAEQPFHLFEGTEDIVVFSQKKWDKYYSSPGWDPDCHVQCDPSKEKLKDMYEKCWGFYKTSKMIKE